MNKKRTLDDRNSTISLQKIKFKNGSEQKSSKLKRVKTNRWKGRNSDIPAFSQVPHLAGCSETTG